MEAGTGMVAVVRGLPDAGLAVTLLDNGKQYTLTPKSAIKEPQPTSGYNAGQRDFDQQRGIKSNMSPDRVGMGYMGMDMGMERSDQDRDGRYASMNYTQQRSKATDVYSDRLHVDTAAQATDGRYASIYKMSHCKVKPTSPPVHLTEFPPQRPALDHVPGRGNFVVGGTGSGDTSFSPIRANGSYRGGMLWPDRGSVCSPRPSREPDAFASSLRKYPALSSPDRSTEIVERLITYTQAKNFAKTRHSASPTRLESCSDQADVDRTYSRNTCPHRKTYEPDITIRSRQRITDECPTRDRPRRTEFEADHRSSVVCKNLDIKYLRDMSKRVRDNIKNMASYVPCSRTACPCIREPRHRCDDSQVPGFRESSEQSIILTSTETQAATEMICREVSTVPRIDPSKRNISSTTPLFQVAVPLTPTSSNAGESVEGVVSNPIPAQAFKSVQTVPNAPLKMGTSVKTSVSSVEISSLKSDSVNVRKIRSEKDLGLKKENLQDKLVEWLGWLDDVCDNDHAREKLLCGDLVEKISFRLKQLLKEDARRKETGRPKLNTDSCFENVPFVFKNCDQTCQVCSILHASEIFHTKGCFRNCSRLNGSCEFCARKESIFNDVMDMVKMWLNEIPFRNNDFSGRPVNKERVLSDMVAKFVQIIQNSVFFDIKTFKPEVLDILNEIPIELPSYCTKNYYFNRLTNLLMKKLVEFNLRNCKKHKTKSNSYDKPQYKFKRYIQPTANELKDFVKQELGSFLVKSHMIISTQRLEEIEIELTDILIDSMETIRSNRDDSVVEEIVVLLRESARFSKHQAIYLANLALEHLKEKLHERKETSTTLGQSNQLETFMVVQNTSQPKRWRENSSSDFSISGISTGDIEANLDVYFNQLVQQIDEWLANLHISRAYDASFRDMVVNDLAGDIVDRQRYLEMNPSTSRSDSEELEQLRYQIFKWINKLVGEDNLETLNHANDLMQRISTIPVPMLRCSNFQNPSTANMPNGCQPIKTTGQNLSQDPSGPTQSGKMVDTPSQTIPSCRSHSCPAECSRSSQVPTYGVAGPGCSIAQAWGQCVAPDIKLSGPGGHFSGPIAIGRNLNLNQNLNPIGPSGNIVEGSSKTNNAPSNYVTGLSNFGSVPFAQQTVSRMNRPCAIVCTPVVPNIKIHPDLSGLSNQIPPNIRSEASSLRPPGATHLTPGTPSIKELNDEFDIFVKKWVQEVPLPASTLKEQEIVEKIRLDLLNAVWKALTKVKSKPGSMNNPFYYEDVLDDEIEQIFAMLPQTPELEAKKHHLKVQMIDKASALNEQIKISFYPETFKQQLQDNVEVYIPRLKTEEWGEDRMKVNEELQILRIAEDFILFTKYKDEDPIRANVYRKKLLKRVQELVDELKQSHGRELQDIHKDLYVNDILSALNQVPLPSDDTINQEADEILLGLEIEEWYSDLPIARNDDVSEQLKRRRLRDALVRRIHEMEKSVNFADSEGERALRYEVSKFLEKVPLGRDESLNINFMVDEITNRIKQRPAAISPEKKNSVIFNETLDYNDFSRQILRASSLHDMHRESQPAQNDQSVNQTVIQSRSAYTPNITQNQQGVAMPQTSFQPASPVRVFQQPSTPTNKICGQVVGPDLTNASQFLAGGFHDNTVQEPWGYSEFSNVMPVLESSSVPGRVGWHVSSLRENSPPRGEPPVVQFIPAGPNLSRQIPQDYFVPSESTQFYTLLEDSNPISEPTSIRQSMGGQTLSRQMPQFTQPATPIQVYQHPDGPIPVPVYQQPSIPVPTNQICGQVVGPDMTNASQFIAGGFHDNTVRDPWGYSEFSNVMPVLESSSVPGRVGWHVSSLRENSPPRGGPILVQSMPAGHSIGQQNVFREMPQAPAQASQSTQFYTLFEDSNPISEPKSLRQSMGQQEISRQIQQQADLVPIYPPSATSVPVYQQPASSVPVYQQPSTPVHQHQASAVPAPVFQQRSTPVPKNQICGQVVGTDMTNASQFIAGGFHDNTVRDPWGYSEFSNVMPVLESSSIPGRIGWHVSLLRENSPPRGEPLVSQSMPSGQNLYRQIPQASAQPSQSTKFYTLLEDSNPISEPKSIRHSMKPQEISKQIPQQGDLVQTYQQSSTPVRVYQQPDVFVPVYQQPETLVHVHQQPATQIPVYQQPVPMTSQLHEASAVQMDASGFIVVEPGVLEVNQSLAESGLISQKSIKSNIRPNQEDLDALQNSVKASPQILPQHNEVQPINQSPAAGHSTGNTAVAPGVISLRRNDPTESDRQTSPQLLDTSTTDRNKGMQTAAPFPDNLSEFDRPPVGFSTPQMYVDQGVPAAPKRKLYRKKQIPVSDSVRRPLNLNDTDEDTNSGEEYRLCCHCMEHVRRSLLNNLDTEPERAIAETTSQVREIEDTRIAKQTQHSTTYLIAQIPIGYKSGYTTISSIDLGTMKVESCQDGKSTKSKSQENLRRREPSQHTQEILEWLHEVKSINKTKIWSERLQKIAEKLKTPEGEEKLKQKLEKYLEKIPSHFSDCDDDGKEFRKLLPYNIIKKLKKMYLKKKKSRSLTPVPILRAEVTEHWTYDTVSKCEEQLKIVVKHWVKNIPIKKRDFLGRPIKKVNILDSVVNKLEPFVIHRPGSDEDYKFILKYYITKIVNEIPIELNCTDKGEYVKKITNELIEKLLNFDYNNKSKPRLSITKETLNINSSHYIDMHRFPQPTMKKVIEFVFDTTVRYLEKTNLRVSKRRMASIEIELSVILMEAIESVGVNEEEVKEDIRVVLQNIGTFAQHQAEHFSKIIYRHFKEVFFKRNIEMKNRLKRKSRIIPIGNSLSESFLVFYETSQFQNNRTNDATDHSIQGISDKDIEANLKLYTDQVIKKIYQWFMTCHQQVPLTKRHSFREKIVKDLARIIVERHRYAESHPESKADEPEQLKVYICQWIRKMIGDGNEETIKYIPELINEISCVPVPRIKYLDLSQSTYLRKCARSETQSPVGSPFVEKLYEEIFDWYHNLPYDLHTSLNEKYSEQFIRDLAENIEKIYTSNENPEEFINRIIDLWTIKILRGTPNIASVKTLKHRIKKIPFRHDNAETINVSSQAPASVYNTGNNTDISIEGISDQDVNANLEYYVKLVAKQIDEWLTELIPEKLDKAVRKVAISDLAGDIVDRYKYLELNPKGRISDDDELENLKYQIFKWIKKLVGKDKNLEITASAPDLMRRIRAIPTPMVSKPKDIDSDKTDQRHSFAQIRLGGMMKSSEDCSSGQNGQSQMSAQVRPEGGVIDGSNQQIPRVIDSVMNTNQNAMFGPTHATETMLARSGQEPFYNISAPLTTTGGGIHINPNQNLVFSPVGPGYLNTPVNNTTDIGIHPNVAPMFNSVHVSNKTGNLSSSRKPCCQMSTCPNNRNAINGGTQMTLDGPSVARGGVMDGLRQDVGITQYNPGYNTQLVTGQQTYVEINPNRIPTLCPAGASYIAGIQPTSQRRVAFSPRQNPENLEVPKRTDISGPINIHGNRNEPFYYNDRHETRTPMFSATGPEGIISVGQPRQDMFNGQQSGLLRLNASQTTPIRTNDKKSVALCNNTNMGPMRMNNLDGSSENVYVKPPIKKSCLNLNDSFLSPTGAIVPNRADIDLLPNFGPAGQGSSMREMLSQAEEQRLSCPARLGIPNSSSKDNETPLQKMSLKEVYEFYNKRIDEKCKALPIPCRTPLNERYAMIARQGMYTQMWKIFFQLKFNPNIERDYSLFELTLENCIDDMLDLLPQTEEMLSIRYGWKARVLLDFMNMLKHIHRISDSPAYRNKLTQKIIKANEKDFLIKFQHEFVVKTADEYILYTRYKSDDPVKANIYRQRLMKRIEELIENVKKKHDVEFHQIVKTRLCEEAFKILGSVPKPNNETLREEADEILVGYEIDEWYKELPVTPIVDDIDARIRSRMRELLAKKLTKLEKQLVQDDSSVVREMRHEVSKYLVDDAVLQKDQNLNINGMVDELTNRLRNRKKPNVTHKMLSNDMPVGSSFAQTDPEVVLAPLAGGSSNSSRQPISNRPILSSQNAAGTGADQTAPGYPAGRFFMPGIGTSLTERPIFGVDIAPNQYRSSYPEPAYPGITDPGQVGPGSRARFTGNQFPNIHRGQSPSANIISPFRQGLTGANTTGGRQAGLSIPATVKFHDHTSQQEININSPGTVRLDIPSILKLEPRTQTTGVGPGLSPIRAQTSMAGNRSGQIPGVNMAAPILQGFEATYAHMQPQGPNMVSRALDAGTANLANTGIEQAGSGSQAIRIPRQSGPSLIPVQTQGPISGTSSGYATAASPYPINTGQEGTRTQLIRTDLRSTQIQASSGSNSGLMEGHIPLNKYKFNQGVLGMQEPSDDIKTITRARGRRRVVERKSEEESGNDDEFIDEITKCRCMRRVLKCRRSRSIQPYQYPYHHDYRRVIQCPFL